MQITNVDQLRALAGKQFLHATYLTLLRRAPDRQGWSFYLSRLSAGIGKDVVIAEIAGSAEGRRIGQQLNGLDLLIARVARARRVPFRLWQWRSASDRARDASDFRLELMEGQVAAIGRHLAYHGAGVLELHAEYDDGSSFGSEGPQPPAQTRAVPPTHAFLPGLGPAASVIVSRITASRSIF